MLPQASCFFTIAATLLLSVTLAEALAKATPEADGPLVLHPIKLRDYESAIGLHRRVGENFEDLDPSTKSQLIYGRPGGTFNSFWFLRNLPTLTRRFQIVVSFYLPT